jgi:ferrous iron transport protein B
VFFVFALQCMSTLAVIRRETNSWRWPVFAFGYLLALAYGASLATHHLAVWLGA